MPKRVLIKTKQALVWIDENLRWVYLILVFLSLLGISVIALFVYSLSNANKDRINDIQAERVRNVRKGCEETNTRHDNAAEALTLIYMNSRKNAIEQGREDEIARINASEQATISVINALVPKQDCDDLVAKLLPSTGVTNGVSPAP